MFSEEQLIQAAENSIFLPTVPGKFEALNIPGIQARYGYGAHGGFINRVGGARLTSEQVPQVINAVHKHFESLGLRYSWFVASSDTPDDLQEQLQRAGFVPGWTISAMILTDLDQNFPSRSGVSVRPATHDERHLVSQIYHVAFPMDKTASDLFADMMESSSMVHYLVYLENIQEPVGATTMFYLETDKVAVLEASAILETYRGQGIYKNLIAQRIHDAHRDGMKSAVVQANEASSEPTLRQLGFIKKSVIQNWPLRELSNFRNL